MENKGVDPSTGQFIDPLFAIMIAAAVTETIVHWVQPNNSSPSLYELSVVILGYINLLLSWFGYHKSVHEKPILGSLRFIITVILLPIYLLTILLNDRPIELILRLYAGIFFLWACWEYFKYIEHGVKDKGFFYLQMRFYNLIVYITCVVLIGHSHLPSDFRIGIIDDYNKFIGISTQNNLIKQ